MILITGGAEYIGSHVVKALTDEGKSVIVVDNLSEGHIQAISKKATFIKGDIRKVSFLDDVFRKYEITSVIHFAANCYVGESIVN